MVQQEHYHIVHFIGHGDFDLDGIDQNPQAYLYFEDGTPQRRRRSVDAVQLFTMLQNGNVPLIVMTACSSAASQPNGTSIQDSPSKGWPRPWSRGRRAAGRDRHAVRPSLMPPRSSAVCSTNSCSVASRSSIRPWRPRELRSSINLAPTPLVGEPDGLLALHRWNAVRLCGGWRYVDARAARGPVRSSRIGR